MIQRSGSSSESPSSLSRGESLSRLSPVAGTRAPLAPLVPLLLERREKREKRAAHRLTELEVLAAASRLEAPDANLLLPLPL